MNLKLKKLIGLCYATDELLEDVSALTNILKKGFADEFSFLIDDSLIRGTGAGQPLGILNSSALVTVSKETGQAASTLQVENILKMYARMLNPSNAVWLIHQTTIPQLYTMGIVVGTGGAPIFMPAGSIAGVPYNTILGRPVIEIEQCEAIGTKGDIFFANFTDGYVLSDKGGTQFAQSIHVRFVYDETTFRWVYRIDGQPVLASKITPYKGSDDLSHFVTLEART
jgi:HK97 family phage major capsid protein